MNCLISSVTLFWRRTIPPRSVSWFRLHCFQTYSEAVSTCRRYIVSVLMTLILSVPASFSAILLLFLIPVIFHWSLLKQNLRLNVIPRFSLLLILKLRRILKLSKFYSLSEPRPVEVNPAGDSVVQEYELEYSPQGVPHLVPTGIYDLYDVIQSFRDECDLGKIFQRYANGDVMALNKRQGVFVDISELPQDIFSANKLIERVEAIYNGLPEDLRTRVGSFEDFIADPLSVLSDHPASDAGSAEPLPAVPASREGGES